MNIEFPVNQILVELSGDNLLPAILFRSSRRQCDIDVERVADSRIGRLEPAKQKILKDEVFSIIAKYGFEQEIITKHPHYLALINTGVGAHHAGQLLMWRLVLEELMTRGLLRLMVATGTVAAGVDFPARTVVVTAHSKRGSEGFRVISSSEFQQMSGRAGRRGKDSVGICLVAPGPFSDARIINEVSKKPAEPLKSAYYAAPSTALNLLKYRNVDDLKFTVSKSLASFLDRKGANAIREEANKAQEEIDADKTMPNELRKKSLKRVRRRLTEADVLEGRQRAVLENSLQGLERLGHVENGALTEKGYWAAELCTSLVLELAEAVDEGIFFDLDVESLVGLIASISGDSHRVYFSLKSNPIKKDLYLQMETVIERVKALYTDTSSDLKVLPDAALTALTWMDSKNWAEFAGLLRLNGVAEGDAARVLTQTADHLNQLARLKESHPDLAECAIEGRKRILKPPLSEVVTGED